MRKKAAYTLIEMIMAIVVMGAIGGIISTLLGNIYQNYATQKQIAQLELKSIQVLSQLQNYFERSIPNSILLHNGTIDSGTGDLDVYDETNYIALTDISFGQGNLSANKTLLWLDIDKENVQGDGPNPNYNQWLDISASTNADLETKDSNLDKIEEIQKNIFGASNVTPAIYFIYGNQQGSPYQKFYNDDTSVPTESTAIFPVDTSTITANTLSLARTPAEIGELFYVSGTGYALSMNGKTLSLIYNWQPWVVNVDKGETFLDGTSKILIENVESFDFWVENNVFRIKICITSDLVTGEDETGATTYANICKERAIGAF
jgi:type II secretory pathway pseudopilin PulG